MEDNRVSRLDEEYRTFETRLQFINDVFSNKFPPEVIMESCIQYKLKCSYESYLDDLGKSIKNLQNADPIAILRKINY